MIRESENSDSLFFKFALRDEHDGGDDDDEDDANQGIRLQIGFPLIGEFFRDDLDRDQTR